MELCRLFQRSVFFHTSINSETILGHRSLEVALWLHMLLSSIKITSVLATSQQIKFDENSSVCKAEMPNNGQIYVWLLHPLNISNFKKQNQQWHLPKLQQTYKKMYFVIMKLKTLSDHCKHISTCITWSTPCT